MEDRDQQDNGTVADGVASGDLSGSELETLQEELAARGERIAALEGTVAQLQEQLFAHQETLAARQQELETRGQEVEALQERLREAVGRFREATLTAQPELPAELVVGETIEEVEASLAAARMTVEQIRSRLAQQLTLESVPAGAPTRGSLDLSALSPKEKIAYGLARQVSG